MKAKMRKPPTIIGATEYGLTTSYKSAKTYNFSLGKKTIPYIGK